jgi:hypothetical protein
VYGNVKSELQLARKLTAALKARGVKVTIPEVSTWPNWRCDAAWLWLESSPSSSFDDWIDSQREKDLGDELG